MAYFTSSKARHWGVSQIQTLSFFSRALKGLMIVDKFGTYLLKKFTIPMKLFNSVVFIGVIMSITAFTLLGHARMPFSSMTYPRNVIELCLNLHLSLFSFMPDPLILFSTASSLVLCSSMELPCKTTSSCYT